MKNLCQRLLVFFAAAVSLLFISALSAQAQPPGRVLEPRVETLETSRDRMHRDHNRIGTDDQRVNDNPFDTYDRRALAFRRARAAQVRQDTERIQFFNTEMMRSVSVSTAPDYDRIIKSTGEIKKRAERLRLNLRLPKLEKSEQPQPEAEILDNQSLTASLKRLDEMVRHFGANPLPGLGNVAVLDVAAVADARRDLGGIISLSDHIRKSAKRLRQQTGR
ncbi:MAG TPA: hypothetical protein VM911_16270 [Pyrinomonadaceae bacterium]|nr:hypothetical protein [Pyrinomonadaceae bacterium]